MIKVTVRAVEKGQEMWYPSSPSWKVIQKDIELPALPQSGDIIQLNGYRYSFTVKWVDFTEKPTGRKEPCYFKITVCCYKNE